jgi:uncharacterized protein
LGIDPFWSASALPVVSQDAESLSALCGKLPRRRTLQQLQMQKIIRQIAAEIRVQEHQVKAAVDLLDGGATVPFVARYRKEATGGLDDIQLRELGRLVICVKWKTAQAILGIEDQGKPRPLRAAIEGADQEELEDLYPPTAARRTMGWTAARQASNRCRRRGPIAQSRPEALREARRGGRRRFTTVGRVDGARYPVGTLPEGLHCPQLREWLWRRGCSNHADGRQGRNNAEVAKFRDYFDYDEPIWRVPFTARWPVLRAATRCSTPNWSACGARAGPCRSPKAVSRPGWTPGCADDLLRKCVLTGE